MLCRGYFCVCAIITSQVSRVAASFLLALTNWFRQAPLSIRRIYRTPGEEKPLPLLVFRLVTVCGLGRYSVQHTASSSGGSIFLRNVGICQLVHTTLQPRIPVSTSDFVPQCSLCLRGIDGVAFRPRVLCVCVCGWVRRFLSGWQLW
jgi:hypothetical protein